MLLSAPFLQQLFRLWWVIECYHQTDRLAIVPLKMEKKKKEIGVGGVIPLKAARVRCLYSDRWLVGQQRCSWGWKRLENNLLLLELSDTSWCLTWKLWSEHYSICICSYRWDNVPSVAQDCRWAGSGAISTHTHTHWFLQLQGKEG